MKQLEIATILLVLFALPISANAGELSYSYLEVVVDVSKTENTAAAPLEKDSNGLLVGIEGSWGLVNSIYVRGAWSKETKDFSNEVAHTALDLDSDQRTTLIGAGYFFDRGSRTSIYFELDYLFDFEVQHSVPLVIPGQFGPPTVTTTDSVIQGDGISATIGLRRKIGEWLELEGQLKRIRTSADIARTGDSISDSESLMKLTGRIYTGTRAAIGTFFAYSKHTDPNFNNIRKLGIQLRYDF